MLFLLLLAAACAASGSPHMHVPHCKKGGWLECVPCTDKPGISTIKIREAVCVLCKVLNGDVASVSPFPFLASANKVAIRGYPFHVLSARKLAPLEHSKVHILALIDAKITDVENNTFAGFSSLEKLSLDSNRLTSVNQTWFTGLENLLMLILSNNSIRQIEPGSFADFTRLQVLDLENNLLQAVDPSWRIRLKVGVITMILRSNAITTISPGAFQHIHLTSLDLGDNDLSCLDEDVFRGQSSLKQLHVSSGMLSSVHDATPHKMTWSLHRLANVFRGSVTMVVVVPKFLFCVRHNTNGVSFGWMFDSSDNVAGNTEFGAVNPGMSCGDLDSSLRTISIKAPVVVLATDGTEKMDPNTLEQCRQVWEYGGGVAVNLDLMGNSLFRLVSMATESTGFEGVAMSLVQTQDTNTRTTTESDTYTIHTNATNDNTRNISCIRITRGEHTKLFFTVPPVQRHTHTTQASYRTGTTISGSPTHYSETTEKDHTSPEQRNYMYSTLQVMSTTHGQDLEVQAPGHVVIPVVVSAVIFLVLPPLVVLVWKVCAARLKAEDDRTSDDAHIWTIPSCVTFPGLLRSASLPACSGKKMASDDTGSCRSLPAVLQSIELTYSQIPDHLAVAQRPLPALPSTCWEIPNHGTAAQHPLPVSHHTYIETPDDESGPMPLYADAEFSLHVITNRRDNGTTSSRCRSGRAIATYGSTGQTEGQRNPFYRNASGVADIRTRREFRAALVSQPALRGVSHYAKVTGAILYCNTPQRASLPTVTPPNTYWPWEIPGEGTYNTPRRASLPTVTLPNTYWPWEIPGEGIRNTP
ncbi:PREDICTED: uncharacterized protein LOC109469569 [Branchiostoma belcheri]|uniref:Uncharacterized protein LOC109469569 n=1 Tax=Branchiostoma belcheri TaxID=7741 RepID=A0A6P4Z269_BRABE|nr:PREDICTED: uncharacterized protein LOC109469569 [Branchiostoma belcheri]